MMTDRITATHVQRAAIVYVRQSSPEQVRNHAESTRIQIGLRDKAVAFGWHNPVTIVDDLGISAGGFAHRAGFQHMAAEVSLGHIGIILCFEASRLSRNSKDWAQLFEVCGHLDTLVADLDQVYDLALPDDRLILGVKGSVSEYELSLFRQRSQAAIVAKAQRGALTFTLPAGLSWTPDERQDGLHVAVRLSASRYSGSHASSRACPSGVFHFRAPALPAQRFLGGRRRKGGEAPSTGSLAPSAARSTYREYASRAALGRRLAAGPFSSL